MNETCDYCHEDAPELFWSNGYQACGPCLDYALYYDSLTPERRQAEEDWMSAYVIEGYHQDHHANTCDCAHRHRPLTTVKLPEDGAL